MRGGWQAIPGGVWARLRRSGGTAVSGRLLSRSLPARSTGLQLFHRVSARAGTQGQESLRPVHQAW